MSNYGDFNFGDDNPDVDTDPFIDKLFSIPFDNVQDDVTNYREPGEDGIAEGQQVTVFDTNSNPEEPGAQQDHISPVKRYRLRRPYSLRSLLDAARHEEQDEGFDAIYPTLSASIDDLFNLYYAYGYNGPNNYNGPSMREMLTKARHGEQDRGFDELKEDPRTIRALLDVFKYYGFDGPIEEVLPSIRYWLDKARHDEQDEGFDALITKPPFSLRPLLDQARHDEQDAVFNAIWEEIPEDSLEVITETILNNQPDPAFPNSIDAFEVALVGQFDNADSTEDSIPGFDDFAESTENPTGIGDFFDKLIVAGFDEDLTVIDSSETDSFFEKLFSDIRIPPTSDEFFDQLFSGEDASVEPLEEMDFLGMDQVFGTFDLADYTGDTTNDSDLIEFQNMGGALENWDGLL